MILSRASTHLNPALIRRTFVHHFAQFQLTRRVAQFFGDIGASCSFSYDDFVGFYAQLTIRDPILTCAQKLTSQLNIPHGTKK